MEHQLQLGAIDIVDENTNNHLEMEGSCLMELTTICVDFHLFQDEA